ncbi:MAG: fimD [Candidatus Eremiobacteraeota bacterium]|nr:fimD [Candidatus Eremiobacteraeota bacterium]
MSVSRAARAAVAIAAGSMILADSPRIDATELPANTPTIAAADPRTFATIVVNGELRGEQIVLVKPDGVYASLAALRAGGLVIPRRVAEGDAAGFVNVRDLAPEVVTVFDVSGPTLRLDAATVGSLTRTSTFSLGPAGDRVRDVAAARSGYLNYSLRAGSAGLSGAQELTLSDSGKTFFSSGTFDARGFHRTLSNVTWSSALKRRRIVLGDVVAESGELGSALMIAGVSVARASDTDPDGQPHTSPTLHGTVLTPSVADVYINGQLIRSIDVAPGAVDFSNLPGSGGVTDATIVLRDAFGRTQALSTRYYGAASVLNKGETDYAFSAGESRDALVRGPGTGRLVGLGRYRLGLTQSTTVGAHAEFAGGFANVGAAVDHAGSLGTWDAAVAQSRDRGVSGLAAGMAYSVSTRNVWVNAAIRAATPSYTSLADRAFMDRTVRDGRMTVGMRPFRGPYTSAITYDASRTLLGASGRRLSWQQSVPLTGGVSMLVIAGNSATNRGSHRDFSVYLFRSARRNSSVPTLNASLESDGSAVRRALEVQRIAPPNGGTGYDVTGYGSGPLLSSGRYEVRSPVGNVDVDFLVPRAGKLTGNVGVSGAIAFAGQYVHPSQPISDSFAIVKVAGGQRVKVLLGNQDMGITDRGGVLVLPNVQSYYAQRVGIHSDDGPVNMDISRGERHLVVASRHGAVAEFSATVVKAVIGKVSVSGIGGTVIPAFGQLSVLSGGKSATAELDRDGNFYLQDIPAGGHAAVIRYGGGECRFAMEFPRTTAIQQNIGEFTCART